LIFSPIFYQHFLPGVEGEIIVLRIFLLVEAIGATMLNFSFLDGQITTIPDGRPGGRAAGLLENKAKTQPAGLS